jgi:AcrR family transcriptional regulator
MKHTTAIDRKEQIVHEAIRIIHENGYSCLSIRELANRVGISEPAIYRHFENKDAIILGILDKMRELGKHIAQRMFSINDPKERIIQFVFLHFEFLEKKPEMMSILFSDEIFEHNEVLERKFNEIIGQRWSLMTGLVESLKSNDVEIKQDTEDLSLILLGLLRMTVLQWKRNKFEYSLTERGKRVINTLINYGLLSH